MKRRKKNIDSSLDASDFIIPYETKKTILALFLIVFGFITTLSIISYSRNDYTYIQNLTLTDFFSLIDRNSDISQNASKINNWLGLIGAVLANFLINDLIGYFSFTIVIVLTFWGVLVLFGNNNFKKSIFYSILILSIGILAATMMGILANSLDVVMNNKELYGSVGFLLGSLSIKLIGAAGGIIIIFLLILIFSTILLNIDLKELLLNFIQKLKYVFSSGLDLISKFFRTSKTESKPKVKVKKKAVENSLEPIEEAKEAVISILPTDEEALVENLINEENKPTKKVSTTTKNSAEKQQEPKTKNTETIGLQPWDESLDFKLPTVDLLDTPIQFQSIDQNELTEKAEMIEKKLKIFKVDIQEIKVTPGPVVTLYEVIPSPNVKVNTITNLKDDIALALKAKGIRLIAPMPGRGTIGVEIPNDRPEIVRASSIFGASNFLNTKYNLPLAMGKTVSGEIFIEDLATMPHLLIAGATGSGKSVGINTIINSILFKLHPAKVKFVLIDPKRIELAMYRKLKRHYLAICPDVNEEIITNPENAVTVLKSLDAEMSQRYEWLSKLDVRNIRDYNEKIKGQKIVEKDGITFHPLPYIIVIVDEFADLMITVGKQIEEYITKLAQMSRAAGIHLIFATQRPSVNVIRGNIKANFPARIAYKVSQRTDSMTILDQTGAEELLGSGDMIFSNNDNLVRVQNAYISQDEINRVLEFIESQDGFATPYLLPSVKENGKGNGSSLNDDEFDQMLVDAAGLILKSRVASVTFLQRKLKVGYARAARIMDQLEQIGIVGPLEGGKNRLVLIDDEEQLNEILRSYGII